MQVVPLRVSEIECGGKSQVTRSTTTAVTVNLSLKGFIAETTKVERECRGDFCVTPATPDILPLRVERGSESD